MNPEKSKLPFEIPRTKEEVDKAFDQLLEKKKEFAKGIITGVSFKEPHFAFLRKEAHQILSGSAVFSDDAKKFITTMHAFCSYVREQVKKSGVAHGWNNTPSYHFSPSQFNKGSKTPIVICGEEKISFANKKDQYDEVLIDFNFYQDAPSLVFLCRGVEFPDLEFQDYKRKYFAGAPEQNTPYSVKEYDIPHAFLEEKLVEMVEDLAIEKRIEGTAKMRGKDAHKPSKDQSKSKEKGHDLGRNLPEF
jgi:hypothetical protein